MIHGHYGYWPNSVLRLCECGCGEWLHTKKRFKPGHWKGVGLPSHNLKVQEIRRQKLDSGEIQVWNKGIKSTQIAWNKGLTKETDSRVADYSKKGSESSKGRIPWNKGLKNCYVQSEESNKKRSQSVKNQIKRDPDVLNRRREGIKKHYNMQGAREAQSVAMKKSFYENPEIALKIGRANKGRKFGEDFRKKQRESMLSQLQERYFNGGQIQPNYNITASEFFKQFNQLFGLDGRYATNKKEKQIAGFFVDYFNDDVKLIIEWDEEGHYGPAYSGGKLSERDIYKQNAVMSEYPDFLFIRLREKDVFRIWDRKKLLTYAQIRKILATAKVDGGEINENKIFST